MENKFIVAILLVISAILGLIGMQQENDRRQAAALEQAVKDAKQQLADIKTVDKSKE